MTWEALGLLFRSPLFVEVGVGLPEPEDEISHGLIEEIASRLHRIFVGIAKRAEAEQDAEDLEAFAAVRPLEDVEWDFVVEALLRVRGPVGIRSERSRAGGSASRRHSGPRDRAPSDSAKRGLPDPAGRPQIRARAERPIDQRLPPA
jgi:hypothetical protein